MKYAVFAVALAAFTVITGPIGAQSRQTIPPPGSPYGVNDPAAVAAMEARSDKWFVLLSQGKAMLNKGEKRKAIALLEQAAVTFPMDEPNVILAHLYSREGKSDDVIRILTPIIYPLQFGMTTAGHSVTTRLIYVLALLDKGDWSTAVQLYEGSFVSDRTGASGQSAGGLTWELPAYNGKSHTLPEKHFNVNDPDYTGLQEQAHLILGARQAEFVSTEDMPEYMLGHLKQAVKYNPDSLDAHFISAFLLDRMCKFKDARAEFAKASRLAPESAQPEIKAAIKELDNHEKQVKELAAWKAGHPAAPSPH